MTEKEKMVLRIEIAGNFKSADDLLEELERAINRLVAQGKLILEKGPNGEPVVRLPNAKETK